MYVRCTPDQYLYIIRLSPLGGAAAAGGAGRGSTTTSMQQTLHVHPGKRKSKRGTSGSAKKQKAATVEAPEMRKRKQETKREKKRKRETQQQTMRDEGVRDPELTPAKKQNTKPHITRARSSGGAAE